jgi:hypothetical protein
MKPKWKRANAGCPGWILDGVRAIMEQATRQTIPTQGLEPKRQPQSPTEDAETAA